MGRAPKEVVAPHARLELGHELLVAGSPQGGVLREQALDAEVALVVDAQGPVGGAGVAVTDPVACTGPLQSGLCVEELNLELGQGTRECLPAWL